MTKKKKMNYKNLKINEESLTTTTIGLMPEEQKGPLFVIVLFAILLGIVFFLPDILNYMNNRNNEEVNLPNSSDKGTSGEPSEIEEEIQMYDLSNNLTITLDEVLTINNFKIANNTINFRIKNNGENRYYFNRYNYFLELYSENNTLLERVILQKEGLAKDSTKDYSYEIKPETSNLAKKIVFTNINSDGYPVVDLINNTLTCTKGYETITYDFIENKLKTINDVVNYPFSSDQNYTHNLLTYQNQVSFNNNIVGVTATLTEASTGFIVNTILDLEKVDITKLSNNNYYAYETLAKIVKFETEARGFSCN